MFDNCTLTIVSMGDNYEVHFMQDWATASFSFPVPTWLDIDVPGRWIEHKDLQTLLHLDNRGTGLPWTGIRLWGTKSPFLRPRYFGTIRVRTQMLINQSRETEISVTFNLKPDIILQRQLPATFRTISLDLVITLLTRQHNLLDCHAPCH
jgi:hypothetical protein